MKKTKLSPDNDDAQAILRALPPVEHPFKSIRRAAVPLVAFETADPQSTIVACQKALNGNPAPCLEWDAIRGLRGCNDAGQTVAGSLGDNSETMMLQSCLGLIAAKYHPTGDELGALFFIHGGSRVLEDWTIAQGLWNLRDKFKSIGATIVLLGPSFRTPAELRHDVVVISEDLPREPELEAIARSICKDAKLTEDPDWNKVVDTLRGLSAFGAEQVAAMSVVKRDGKPALDMSALWERKRKLVEQTPGLSVWRGGERFDDIGGCDSIKAYLRDYMNGPARMRAVVWLDEIEKSLSGATGGDLSGVSSDYLGQLLTYMQDSGARGMIFIGPPGAAKSAIAKCTGNEANVPTIALDLGGMKGSLVGQSEMQLRNALKVIDAISDGKALWIATCNSLGALPPELKRRFALGTWFMDLPVAEERAAIWKIYAAKYPDVKQDAKPEEFPGWTGAEIKALFDTAWSTGRPLSRAAKIIVPVCKSAADRIEALRREAVGKFTNAGKEGIYTKPESDSFTGRKLQG